MKILSPISNDKDITSKEYVDTQGGSDPNYGLSINGHTVTISENEENKSVTIPDDDTKVSQYSTTTNAKYPLLSKYSSGTTSTTTSTNYARYNNNIYMNPSSGAIYATKIYKDGTELSNYSLPTASSTLGGVKTTSTVTSKTGYTAVPIIEGVPYYKDTTYSNATTSTAGLMSATDKTAINNLDTTISTAITNTLKAIYPIGTIVFNTSGTNPNTYLGFGTWTKWGAGKVPVGVDTSDTDFNTVEKTGGNKKHKHTQTLSFTDHYSTSNGLKYTESDSIATNVHYTGEESSLQPYITCYMWKRTQ